MLAKHDVGAVHVDGKLCREGSAEELEELVDFLVAVGLDDDIVAEFLGQDARRSLFRWLCVAGEDCFTDFGLKELELQEKLSGSLDRGAIWKYLSHVWSSPRRVLLAGYCYVRTRLGQLIVSSNVVSCTRYQVDRLQLV